MSTIDSQILSDRARAEEAAQLAEDVVNGIDSAIIITDEGEDYIELKAFAPSELVEGSEQVGGYEIEFIDIIQN